MKTLETNQSTDKSEFSCSKWLHYRHRLRFAIFRRDLFRCRYCGRSPQDGTVLTLEHFVPISKGGTFDVSNLLTACHECNQGKSDDILTIIEQELLKSSAVLFNDLSVSLGVML